MSYEEGSIMTDRRTREMHPILDGPGGRRAIVSARIGLGNGHHDRIIDPGERERIALANQ